jgi:DNA-directed RNA polymerase subunit RPC12/RpoP
MSSETLDSFEKCTECGKEFRHVETSDPRKGYDVLWEYTERWEIRCKGCGTSLVVPK